jgi:hypothetical protein
MASEEEMTFEEFEKATKAELRSRAKDCFDNSAVYQPSDPMLTVPLILNAQFYMQELDRRHGSRIAVRDLILEIVVILLIGGEIWHGFKAAKEEGALMDKQNAILANLADSTADRLGQ